MPGRLPSPQMHLASSLMLNDLPEPGGPNTATDNGLSCTGLHMDLRNRLAMLR